MFRKILLGLAAILFTHAVYGQSLQRDIDRASSILQQRSIPQQVLDNAKGIAVMSIVKGGFIFSGRIGSGLVVAKTAKGWSAPSAIGMAGAGFGAQIGGSITSFVLVLNTQAALDAFSRGSVTLGGNLSVAAGPVGGAAEGSLALPPAAIYSYSVGRGVFVGASLEGSVITEKSDVNAEFYGKPVRPSELLSGNVAQPKSARALYRQLER